MANNKITMLSEEFEVEQTGEKVEGITLIVDGPMKQFLQIIQERVPKYQSNLSIVQDALMKGLEMIRNDIR